MSYCKPYTLFQKTNPLHFLANLAHCRRFLVTRNFRFNLYEYTVIPYCWGRTDRYCTIPVCWTASLPNNLDQVTHWHRVGDEEFCLIENRKLFFRVVSFDDYLIRRQKKNTMHQKYQRAKLYKILPFLVTWYKYIHTYMIMIFIK